MKTFFLLGLLSFNAVGATLSEQVNAAKKIANTDPSCVAIRPFYWEIGDGLSALVSGSAGIGAPTAKTELEIASASKWIFSAYVAQKRSGQLTVSDKNHLRFLTGYDQFTSCLGSQTVDGCFQSGSNNDQTISSIGKFAYGGGHMQKLAVGMGLGDLTSSGLAVEVNSTLGIKSSYSSPQPAGGMEMTAQDYGFFLRKLLNNKLQLSNFLGVNPVCTTESSCPLSVVSSPAPMGWEYSYGHWVESDGVFSSPGKFGFYPWMDKTNGLYGVVGRKSADHEAYLTSVECGQKIRNAFFSGK
ncbi:hypothetical protein [Peredibacter starrii]|uniref:Beta-lactamase n=1 Tax=Peredibacter starrii TaxID=28202 RepID=A0AAX4HLU6_9BACT|nr:hypothetical protein [Peredibacter starrii]WPU64186.1 hypothetical protein SOO65_15940 [Peredibacter starrii]